MSLDLNIESKKNFQRRFSDLLRSFRQENRLTQTDIAKQLGVTMPLVTRLESTSGYQNRAVSSYEFFKKISLLVGISYSELAQYFDNEVNSDPSWQAGMSEKFSQLKGELQYKLIGYLNKVTSDTLQDDLRFFLKYVQMKQVDKEFLQDMATRLTGIR